MIRAGQFDTITACMAVFDPECLAHRADEFTDWWTAPKPELDEVRAGNCLFIDLGAEAVYNLFVHDDELPQPSNSVVANLRCRSGRIYLGAAEDVISSNTGPGDGQGGMFVEVAPGNYMVSVSAVPPANVHVSFARSEAAENDVTKSLVLRWPD